MKYTHFFVYGLLWLVIGCDANQSSTSLEAMVTAKRNNVLWSSTVTLKPSSYTSGEVVAQAFDVASQRTLQLTFPLKEGITTLNAEMTGLWDLGLCLPANKFLLDTSVNPSVVVRYINGDSSRISVTFTVAFRNSQNLTETVQFVNGTFEVRLDKNAFSYCIEG
ncbi:MAG: hypothetical protein JNN12_16255 [Bacteroidetes Order II. Incertae sedis bacterium]|nr:hypothetical protein [Bacteroidetes Order II. bacterium]